MLSKQNLAKSEQLAHERYSDYELRPNIAVVVQQHHTINCDHRI
jgi:hypothetical protein